MVLDCALEVGFLRVLGGMVLSVMLVGGFAIFLRGRRRVYFSQDYMCCVLKNFGDCCICSVSERLRRYFAAMKLCGEPTEGGCDFGNFLSKCRCVGVFLFAGLSGAWSGRECGQERWEVEVWGPDWMRWASLGGD